MEGKEPKIDSIPVKFDVWDTYYHVKDYGDKVEVSIPCRKYGKGRDKDSWTLGHYTEETVNPELMAMIRLMVESGKPAVFAKEGMGHFDMVQVVVGLPLAYGWRAKDFE